MTIVLKNTNGAMMNPDTKKSKKDKIISFIAGTIGIGLTIFMIPMMFQFFAPTLIAPSMARELAKDSNNIRSGGCLTYAGRIRGHTDSYSVNRKTSRRIEDLTLPEFPFIHKWYTYDANFLIDFEKKYSKKHSKECFKVKYISTKVLWVSTDFIYDTDEMQ